MNVAGRKIAGIDGDAGQRRLQIIERAFDVARDLQRVRAELFLDDQQQAGAVVDDGIADRLRKSLDDGGDVADSQRRAVSRRHDDALEIAS